MKLGKGSQGMRSVELSPMQKSIWINEQISSEKGIYNLPIAVSFEGEVDDEKLSESIKAVVQRHFALTFSFFEKEGRVYQSPGTGNNIGLNIEDLTKLPIRKRRIELNRRIEEIRAMPFDLSTGPLVRFSLLRFKKRSSILLMVIHHLVSDAWSQEILLRDLKEHYSTGCFSKKSAKLNDYLKFILEHRDAYDSDVTKHWLKKYHDMEGATLPSELNQVSSPKNAVALKSFRMIDNKVLRSLRTFSAERKSSLFSLSLSISALVLSHFSNERRFFLPITKGNRKLDLIGELVSCMTSQVLIPINTGFSSRFEEYFKNISNNLMEALSESYPDISSVKKQSLEEYGVHIDTRINFLYQNSNSFERKMNEQLVFAPYKLHTTPAIYDLTLSFTEGNDGLSFSIEYRDDLYSDKLIDALSNMIVQMFTKLSISFDQKISELLESVSLNKSVLIGEKTQELPSSIGSIIERSFEEYPDNVALVHGQRKMTFSELQVMVDSICNIIEARDLKVSYRIGLYGARDFIFIASLLAILKSKCCYVPLCSSQPLEVNEKKIQAGNLDLVLCAQHARAREYPKVENVVDVISAIENLSDVNVGKSSSLVLSELSRRETSLIFTSGSTGEPQGVLGSEIGLINRLEWQRKCLPLNENSRVLQKTSINFVDSIAEILAPFSMGAVSFIYDDIDVADADKLADCIHQNKITNITLVPSLLSALLIDESRRKKIDCLKTIVSSGEVLKPNLINWVESYLKNSNLINIYGSTEVTADVTFHNVTSSNRSNSVIGKPISNTHVYVLDNEMRPVSIGAVGEIYIAGYSVANGYLSDKAGRSKFVSNPFSDSDDLIFKTGDFGRVNFYGELEYIGRESDFVKVRGNRVCLVEIENVVSQYKKVKHVVCSVTGDNQDILECIVVPLNNKQLIRQELQQYLSKRLPTYLMPNKWRIVSQIPRSKTGKLLRNNIDWSKYEIEYQSPNQNGSLSSTQSFLLNVFAEATRNKMVNLEDDFFTVGGHSLIALDLISKINEQLNASLKLQDLYENPTVLSLEKLIRETKTESPATEVIVIQEDSTNEYSPFALLPMQQAYWIGTNQAYSVGDISTSVYFEMKYDSFSLSRFEKALNKLISRHPMLRAVIKENGEQVVLRNIGDYEVVVEDISKLTELEKSNCLRDKRESVKDKEVSYSDWPLFELSVTKSSKVVHILHVRFEMVMVDLFSSQLLMNELNVLYDEPSANLPEINVSFRDYVNCYYSSKSSQRYLESKKYWEKKILTLPSAPQLPLNSEYDLKKQSTFVRKSFELKRKLWKGVVDELSLNKLNATSFLLSTFSNVLSIWSRGNEFTLNLTQFQRHQWHRDINKVVGEFTSTLLHHFRGNIDGTLLQSIEDVQSGLVEELDNSFYSGIEVIRDITSLNHGEKTLFPIVFTSLLGLPEINLNDASRAGLAGNMSYSVTQSSQVWLDFQVAESEGNLIINWDVVEDIFPDGLIEQIFKSYCKLLTLLASDVENLSLPVKELVHMILPELEEQSLQLFKPTIESGYATKRIFDLVLDAVKNYPHKYAVVSPERTLDYETLVKESLQFAKKLDCLNVKKGDKVGLVMDKKWDAVVAMMSVVMLGGAYIPIDPSWPKERIRLISKKAKIDVMVTQESYFEFVKSISESVTTVSDLDGTLALDKLESVSYKDLAYVIYTSGTSGEPKGVMIEHGAVMNTILAVNDLFEVTHNDRSLCLSSLCFDLSVYDIWGMLNCGGTVVLPEKDILSKPWTWLDVVNDNEITIWNTVPALAQLYFDSSKNAYQENIRLFLISGDWIPLELPLVVSDSYPNAQFISLGGATEASIWSIYFPVSKVEDEWASIPYGKSLPGQLVSVLDEDFSPCPTWKTGDIFISGKGVATGYLGNERQTEKQFITSPINGNVYYKTGDLGRYRSDGNIEFLGREDSQVKLNGYRIELGEIEKQLDSHISIKKSVVTVFDKNKLAAHVVINESSESRDEISIDSLKGNVIRHPAERLKFKMALAKDTFAGKNIDLGLLEIAELNRIEYYKRQSYRDYLGKGVRKSDIASWIGNLTRSITNDNAARDSSCEITESKLIRLLSSLVGLKVEGIPLLKYRYPSAGHTYTVGFLLNLPVNNPLNIDSGVYFLDQTSGNLVLCENEKLLSNEMQLLVVGDTDRLEKLYGEWSKKFIVQEVGYISELLKGVAKEQNISIKLLHHMEGISTTLISKYCLLSTISFSADSTLDDQNIIGETNEVLCDICFDYIVSFSDGTATEEMLLENGPGDSFVPSFLERKLVDSSVRKFQLFLVAKKEIVRSETQEWLAAASVSQKIMDSAEQYGIGVCQKGNDLEVCNKDYRVVLNFECGSISEQQIITLQIAQDSSSKKSNIDAGILSDYLKEKLPLYLVPSYYSQIKEFPFNSNGKVDRSKLNEELQDSIELHTYDRQPSTEIERYMIGIWQNLLNTSIDSLGVNFFSLGGDSLSATQLVSKIRLDLKKEVTLQDLYQNSNLYEFCEFVGGSSSINSEQQLTLQSSTVDPSQDSEPFLLSEMQRSYLIGLSVQSSTIAVSANSYFEIDYNSIDIDRLEVSVNKLIDRHQMLRSVVIDSTRQQILPNTEFYKIEGENICDLPQDKQKAVLIDKRNGLSHAVNNPEVWPNFSIKYTKHGDSLTRLHVSFDLIVADTWSANIIVYDLFRIYADEEISLPKFEVSFKDFISYSEREKHTELYLRAKDYWLNKIPNLPMTPALPRIKEPYELAEFKFNRRKAEIHESSWLRLRSRVKSLGVTINSFLITVFSNILRTESFNDSFTLNLTEYNRPGIHPQEKWLVGNFTTTLLLDCPYVAGQNLNEQVSTTCEKILEGKDNSHFSGIEVMRELSKYSGKLASMPIVFTSALGIMENEEIFEYEKIDIDGKTVFAITQTPQVLFDHQVHTRGNTLILVWDIMKGVFDDEMLDRLFSKYVNTLEELAINSQLWTIKAEEEIKDNNSYSAISNKTNISSNLTYAKSVTELAICAVWEEVFKERKISMEDNFFRIGGSSLQALQIISRIQERYMIEFDLNIVMENPTLSGMVQQVESNPLWVEQLELIASVASGNS